MKSRGEVMFELYVKCFGEWRGVARWGELGDTDRAGWDAMAWGWREFRKRQPPQRHRIKFGKHAKFDPGPAQVAVDKVEV